MGLSCKLVMVMFFFVLYCVFSHDERSLFVFTQYTLYI